MFQWCHGLVRDQFDMSESALARLTSMQAPSEIEATKSTLTDQGLCSAESATLDIADGGRTIRGVYLASDFAG